MNGARVLLLGVTYKKNIADQRESPAQPIARKLAARGAVLSYHDPYVEAWTVDGVPVTRAARPDVEADLVILLQAHDDYDVPTLAAGARLFLDTRGVLAGQTSRTVEVL
jgi:UDP-N-acetyl-D-glucosamine dehydrogenase